jgi:cell division protein FtsN
MPLKKLVLALLVINLGYFVYSQGWLQSLIGGDGSQREPERMTKQINPDAILVKPTSALAKSTVAAPANPTATVEACLQDREEWVIYMGPYATTTLRDNKKAELKKFGIANKEIAKSKLPVGLSLGQFNTEAAAREELKRLAAKGVRTATVMLWDKVTAPCPTGEKP